MSTTIQGKKSAGPLPKIPEYSDSDDNWANAGCRRKDDLLYNPNVMTNDDAAALGSAMPWVHSVTVGRGGYMACYDKTVGHRCSEEDEASAAACAGFCNSASLCEVSDRPLLENSNAIPASAIGTWMDGWLPYVRRTNTNVLPGNHNYVYDFQRHSRSVTRDAANKDMCELEFNYDAVEGGYGLPQDGFQGFQAETSQAWSNRVNNPPTNGTVHGVDANGWRTGFDTDNVQCDGDTGAPIHDHPSRRTCNFKPKSGGSQAQVTDACSGETAGTGTDSCKIKCQYKPETFKPRMNIFYQRDRDIGGGSCIPTSDTPNSFLTDGGHSLSGIQSCHRPSQKLCNTTLDGYPDCVWIPRNTEQQPHGIDPATTDTKCMRRNKHGVYPGYYCTSSDNACSDTGTEPQGGQIAGTPWTRVIDATSGAMTYTATGPVTVTAIPDEVVDAEADSDIQSPGPAGRITGTPWTRMIANVGRDGTFVPSVSYRATESVTVTSKPHEVEDAERDTTNSMAKINSKLGACFYTGDIPAARIMFDENEIKKRVAIISKYKEQFIQNDSEGSHCNYGTIMADFCQNIDASYKRGGDVPGETDPNHEKGFQSFYSSQNPALHEIRSDGTSTDHNICKKWYTSTKDQPLPLPPGDMNDDHNDWLSGDCDGYSTTSHHKMDGSINDVCDSLVGVLPGQPNTGKITNPDNLDTMCKCVKKEDRADYYLPWSTPNTPEHQQDAKCWNSGCMLSNDENTYLDDKTTVDCPPICIVGVFIEGNTAGGSQTFNVENNNIAASCPSRPTGAHCLYTVANPVENVSSVATDDGSRCTLDIPNGTCTTRDATAHQCTFADVNSHTSVGAGGDGGDGGAGGAGGDDDADAAGPGAGPDDDDDDDDDDAAAAAAAAAAATAAAAKATKLNEMLFAGLAAAILVPWFVWLFIPAPWWLMLIISVVAIVVVYTRYKREKKKST